MKSRKVKDLIKILKSKGFEEERDKDHIRLWLILPDGTRSQRIWTYFSHGKKEYNGIMMNLVRKQLKFNNDQKLPAEDFFDCPLSYEAYLNLLEENGEKL